MSVFIIERDLTIIFNLFLVSVLRIRDTVYIEVLSSEEDCKTQEEQPKEQIFRRDKNSVHSYFKYY